MSTAFSPELWRRHRWLWLGPLLLVLGAGGLLSVYRSTYSGRVALLERQLDRERAELEDRRQQRAGLEQRLRDAEVNRRGIERLYRETFATERERLTAVIREVRELARTAGLEPASVSYPEETLEEHGLVRKSFVFQVQGDYSSLRKLINFLEVSSSFLVLERIQVSDTSRSGLAISLQLSTLFAVEGSEPASSGRRPATGGSR